MSKEEKFELWLDKLADKYEVDTPEDKVIKIIAMEFGRRLLLK